MIIKRISAILRKTHPGLKLNSLGRFVAFIILGTVMITAFNNFNVDIKNYIIFITMASVWPPAAFILAYNNKDQLKFDITFNNFLDSFLISVWAPLIKFNPYVFVFGFIATGVAGIISAGISGFVIRIIAMLLGFLTGILIFGFEFSTKTSLSTIALCFAGLCTIAFSFSYISYRASRTVTSTKKLLREQKYQLEQLSSKLSKYLSPQIYDSIFTGKKDAKIEAVRKKLTVFFSDIKGFTETTDTMEAEDLTSMLNHYLNEMTSIALKHGGTIDKYIGDAIMIFFGDPETNGVKDDALKCVSMAIEMRNRMEKLRKEWLAQGVAKPLSIRMGINTGFCTVGNFGSDNRLDYTIIGGQVNLASRLESNAETDSILISEETYLLVEDKILCSEAVEIIVKGILRPVKTYNVIDHHINVSKHDRIITVNQNGISISVDLRETDVKTAVSVLKKIISRIST